MKMEKLNENQLKVDIFKEDLIDRDLNIAEIFYGGDKVRDFFHELMEIAYEEHDFSVNNIPILVEALPMNKDEISLMVTKIVDAEDFQDKLDHVSKDGGMVRDLMSKLVAAKNSEKEKAKEKEIKSMPKSKVIKTKENLIIFSFDNIDLVANVSKRIESKFEGTTILYKNEKKYYLLLETIKSKKIANQDEIENILNEYGDKHISTGESKFYLKEHGEVIIKKDALKVLAKHL